MKSDLPCLKSCKIFKELIDMMVNEKLNDVCNAVKLENRIIDVYEWMLHDARVEIRTYSVWQARSYV